MFKLVREATFWAPVTVKVPNEAGGYDTARFKTRFKVLAQSRVRELGDGGQGDAGLLKEAVIGWTDLADETGAPLPFSDEALGGLLDLPYMQLALVETYLERTLNGRYKAKN